MYIMSYRSERHLEDTNVRHLEDTNVRNGDCFERWTCFHEFRFNTYSLHPKTSIAL